MKFSAEYVSPIFKTPESVREAVGKFLDGFFKDVERGCGANKNIPATIPTGENDQKELAWKLCYDRLTNAIAKFKNSKELELEQSLRILNKLMVDIFQIITRTTLVFDEYCRNEKGRQHAFEELLKKGLGKGATALNIPSERVKKYKTMLEKPDRDTDKQQYQEHLDNFNQTLQTELHAINENEMPTYWINAQKAALQAIQTNNANESKGKKEQNQLKHAPGADEELTKPLSKKPTHKNRKKLSILRILRRKNNNNNQRRNTLLNLFKKRTKTHAKRSKPIRPPRNEALLNELTTKLKTHKIDE